MRFTPDRQTVAAHQLRKKKTHSEMACGDLRQRILQLTIVHILADGSDVARSTAVGDLARKHHQGAERRYHQVSPGAAGQPVVAPSGPSRLMEAAVDVERVERGVEARRR
mmetsp:Transcript_22024/g.59398  ORF Transcript_22024/g.59398 Transcript_22024/m.59398 type:complete len:110 (-) Transcript_22024:362-691(-)